jgi:spermidine/putrescine transport system permease protein
VDHKVVEAGRDLYANPLTVFTKVVLPLSLPGVFAGMLLNFVPAASDYVNDFITTEFTSGSFVTYPLWIWSVSRQGLPPQVNVMGSIVFAAGVLFAVVNSVVSRRRAG